MWIDEAELRFGAQLGATLQARIEEPDVVVVVASEASAISTWVAFEIRHAQPVAWSAAHGLRRVGVGPAALPAGSS